MIVLTGREMAALDARARDEYGLPGIVLMENAGRELARVIEARFGQEERIAIVCGPGNNGGDGFAAGRHLFLAGRRITLLPVADEYRGDALTNLTIARALGVPGSEIRGCTADRLAEALRGADIIVDAYFGTGFRGAPRPEAAGIISAVNAAGKPIVAVDIPSGVEADTGAVLGEAVRAALTVTFAAPKLGCVLHPGAGYCGELVVAPISLPVSLLAPDCPRTIPEPAEIGALLPRRARDAHKGSAGHLLVIGGSPGLTGAPFLAAKGALRSGAGLVTVMLPAGLPLAEKPAEVMVAAMPAEGAAGVTAWFDRVDAIAIGPGLGLGSGSWDICRTILESWQGPLVIDADALNLLAEHLDYMRARRGPWILTPHPGEAARLAGAEIHEIQADRVGWAREFACAHGVHVILKGVPTVVAAPTGRVALNPTGHPAMAAGGMGDVLTGVVGSLLGQGVAPGDAAIAGPYLHGLAGEIAAAAIGATGVLAGEVADALPSAARRVSEVCRVTRN